MYLRQFLALFALSLALSGCFSPRITGSRQVEGYVGKVNKVLIVYMSSRLGAEEANIKKDEFQKIAIPFEKAHVDTSLLLLSSLEFDARKKLAACAQDRPFVLFINPVRMVLNEHGRVEQVDHNCRLYDTRWRQNVWVANLSLSSAWFSGAFRKFEEMGDVIVKQLQDNKLIKVIPKKKIKDASEQE